MSPTKKPAKKAASKTPKAKAAKKKTVGKKTKPVEAKSNRWTLSGLAPKAGSRHRRKRLGIGEGSGSGKTSGRGQKGAGARTGSKSKRGFEGGQMPLHRRLPKVGFTSRKKTIGRNVFVPISLAKLEQIGEDVVTLESLINAGFVSSPRKLVKILGGGELTKKLTVHAHAASESAKAAIEKAGGELKLIGQAAAVSSSSN
jgi:large subunit ribosomal protein L15